MKPLVGTACAARVAIAVALFAVAPCAASHAAEFERLDVSEDSGTYRIEATLLLDAPAEAVVRALLDFAAQRTMSPPIRSIDVVGSAPAGGKLVKVVTDICLGPFCRSVEQLQVVRFQSPGEITATVVPGRGDLKSGRTVVEVLGAEARARLRIDCSMEPSRRRPFFIPKGWVLSAIRRQARQSARGIEALALRAASPVAPAPSADPAQAERR